MVHSILFRLSVFLGCLLAGIAAIEQLHIFLQGVDHISVFYRWIGQRNMTFGSYYLFQLMPLLAAVCYSHTLCSDRTGGYLTQLITRVGKKKYYFAKYVFSFVGGGFIPFISLLFNYLLLACFMPAEIPDPGSGISMITPFQFASTLYYSAPYLYVFLRLIVSFLLGGSISLVGLLAALFTDKAATAAVMPFVIWISEAVIGLYLMQKRIFIMGYYTLELVWNEYITCSGNPAPTAYVIAFLSLLIGLCSIVYMIKVKMNENL